ncbi:MAG: ankyrin repeat domain-containing protein, partial [Planctomycetota bacterium]|nr:ankyrin repeat domain-containing protein [Planctomycetota bacterium]
MNSSSRRSFVINSLSVAGIAALPSGVLGANLLAKGRCTLSHSEDTKAFILAVINGDMAAFQAMLRNDASLRLSRDDVGRSAFALAMLHRHLKIADLLLEAGHQPDLHEAALGLDWDLFNELSLANPARVNEYHPIGGTAMVASALGGAGSELWRVYAKSGTPNPSRPQAKTRSPLRASLDFPELDPAEMSAFTLLSNGADPNQPEPEGSTALHAASARGLYEIVEMLIRKGANLDARNSAGHTPIDVAERAGHHSIVTLLRDHQSIPRDHSTSRRAYDVNGKPYRAPDWEGLPFKRRRDVVSKSHRNLDVVRAEIRLDSRLAHSVSTMTEGAVEAGAHMGNQAMVELLLENGAPYSLPTVVMRGDIGRARELLAEDPLRIHERGAHDYPLLMFPVFGRGNLEMAMLLLDSGAEVEKQQHLGT